MVKMFFPLGRVTATVGAVKALMDDGISLASLLTRHASGDWGRVSERDRRENEVAVKEGFRIKSSYSLPHSVVWVITEPDRSATRLILPSEY